jgi:hypothetical protein
VSNSLKKLSDKLLTASAFHCAKAFRLSFSVSLFVYFERGSREHICTHAERAKVGEKLIPCCSGGHVFLNGTVSRPPTVCAADAVHSHLLAVLAVSAPGKQSVQN